LEQENEIEKRKNDTGKLTKKIEALEKLVK